MAACVIIHGMNNIIDDSNRIPNDTPAEKVFRFIRESDLQPGSQLPVREKLGERLGLGPRVLREALSVLEHQGVIRTKSKAGTIVDEPSAGRLESPLRWYLEFSGYEPADMVRARAGIEGAAAYEAAKTRTARDLLVILDALEELENRQKHKENDTREELEFHLAILSATHNPVMMIFDKLIITNIEKTCGESVFEGKKAKKSNRQHRKIYHAIENKLPPQAMELMYSHILSQYSK